MLNNSTTGRRWFESITQLVVLYSIVIFYIETELLTSGHIWASSGFWLWNERLLLTFFSIEYLFRWAQSENKLRYPFTLLAVIDLLAVAPAAFGVAMHLRSLKMLRALRMLRLFKLYRYNRALQNVMHGFRKVKEELAIVGFVALIVMLFGSMLMHEFEHDAQPDKFARLSDSMWWSFVTLTTVGYGDLYPISGGGRIVAAMTMLFGIGIFGTFISLVGSSFLATMREQRESDLQDVSASKHSTAAAMQATSSEEVEESRSAPWVDTTADTVMARDEHPRPEQRPEHRSGQVPRPHSAEFSRPAGSSRSSRP